jgi:ribosomal protein L40E
MTKDPTWYERGFGEGTDGICDPPYMPGNPSYENYMAGARDAHKELERLADFNGCRTCYEANETRAHRCDECGHIDEDEA